MKPAAFSYHAPTSLDEAVALLRRYAGDAKVLAGGQSLIPLLNFRLARPNALVDISRIPGLDYVREQDGMLEIGALTRQRTVERSQLARSRCPLLVEAIRHIGHFQIRNRGTIGGSIAHADPAAELPAVLTALDGQLVMVGPAGVRTASPSEFFLTIMTTSLMPDEILTAVRFPALPDGAGWSFQELSRRSGDFALVAVAAALLLDGHGRIAWVRLGLSGVDAIPVRPRETESFLMGKYPTEELLQAAGAQVQAEIAPESDLHGTEGYRREVTALLLRDALAEAAVRAGGGGRSA